MISRCIACRKIVTSAFSLTSNQICNALTLFLNSAISTLSPSIPSSTFPQHSNSSEISKHLPIVAQSIGIMASTQDYALLVLENPLLGELPLFLQPTQRLKVLAFRYPGPRVNTNMSPQRLAKH